MKLAAIARCACAAAAAALAACSGNLPQVTSPAWPAADAARASRLLYVSDLKTFDVYVYEFPSLKLTKKLKGFDEPEGLCTDASGDVWIADTANARMVEYAHGGSTPIATLADPTGYPSGCAVDRHSGDLAVTNFFNFSNAGSVLIYSHEHGAPRLYGSSEQFYNYFDAYNKAGDLYVSGTTYKNVYTLSVIPHGSGTMKTVSIGGGTLYVPGTVAWVGSTLVLGDQKCKNKPTSCLYRLKVSGSTASITGVTRLTGSCDVVEAWVGKTEIVGGDDSAYCAGGHSSVDVWRYPSGGKPRRQMSGPRIPIGATISNPSSV